MSGRPARYHLLAEQLSSRISNGEFPPGVLLPSERELSDLLSCSRVSLRKALLELHSRGMLCRDENHRLLVIEKTAESSVVKSSDANPSLGSDMAFVTNLERSLQLDIYWMIYEELLRLCAAQGSRLFYVNALHAIPQRLQKTNFRAVFIAQDLYSSTTQELLQPFLRPKTRIILFDDCRVGKQRHSVVSMDNYDAGQRAVRCLYERGRRKLLFIGVRDAYGYLPFNDRKNGFVNRCAEYGLPTLCFDLERYSSPQDFAPLEEFLRSHEVDGIFVFNDNLAIRVLRLLAGMGFKVPERISVCGLDGLEVGTLASPPLTTVAQPVQEMARCAFRLATARDPTPPEVLRVPGYLLTRDSV